MQAYLADGSQKHLRAGTNAFAMIKQTQSFATGGWGPNESFVAPDSGALYASLSETHRGFETPCGSYAHFKLTRYLLRVTRNGSYGDSMEQVLYNTVLGAKRLEPDGRAFYYSDYNYAGRKSYFPDAWPCCSGTLPQVAADYRILIYLREADSLYVNLYLPSRVRWTNADGAQVTLTQRGDYPEGGKVTAEIRTSRSTNFALRLRMPGWLPEGGAMLRINGERAAVSIQKGFATVRQQWKDGDRVDMEFAMPMRLSAVDALHPNTVALVRGPLVLLAQTNNLVTATRQQLLAATRLAGEAGWQASTAAGPVVLRPFATIGDEPYSTYVNVA